MRWFGLAFVCAAAAALSGCGGSQGSGSVPRLRGPMGLAAGGMRDAALAGSAAGAGGFGGFVREIALRPRSGDSSGGGSNGEGGWEGDPGFWYDEWLELWVEAEEGSSGWTFRLYEDEQKTLPAGQIVSEFPEDQASYPQTSRHSYQILRGPYQGAQGQYEFVQDSEKAGRYSYEDVRPDGGRTDGRSTYGDGSSAWESRSVEADGYWCTSSGHWRDGSDSTSDSRDSAGYRAQFTHRPDGSGEARLEGPEARLPATMTWTADGRGRVEWADGTVEEFRWDDVVSSDKRRSK